MARKKQVVYRKPKLSDDLNGDELDRIAGGGCRGGSETCSVGEAAVGVCSTGSQIRKYGCSSGSADRYECRSGNYAGVNCSGGSMAPASCNPGVAPSS